MRKVDSTITFKPVLALLVASAIGGCGPSEFNSPNRNGASAEAVYAATSDAEAFRLIREFSVGDWVYESSDAGTDAYRLSVTQDGTAMRFYMTMAPVKNWGDGITDELEPYKDVWSDNGKPMYGFKTKDGAIRFIIGPDGNLAHYEFEYKQFYRMTRTKERPLEIEYEGGRRVPVGIIADRLKLNPSKLVKINYISPAYGDSQLFPSRRASIRDIPVGTQTLSLVLVDKCDDHGQMYDEYSVRVCLTPDGETVAVTSNDENLAKIDSMGAYGAILGGGITEANHHGNALLVVP